MPTLDWIGKNAVVKHHHEVPYHLLRKNEELSFGASESGNLLIQGDNLITLKALLPYYSGQVKCICIDPPYNTGEETWVFNDSVNSTEIKNWLGKVVGKEHADLSRHDKWLCMMYPRLSLLRLFLRRDGIIFVSIDEHEVANLRLLMDEIFGPQNALGTLVWKRRSSSAMRGTPLSTDHEYVLAYGLDSNKTTMMGLSKGIESYPNVDQRGSFASTDLTVGMGKDQRPGQFYPLENPRSGKVYQPNPERVWRFHPETMKRIIEQDLIIWPEESSGKMERPRYKTYFDPNTEKLKPVSTWIERPNLNDKLRDSEEADYGVTILTSGMTQEGGKLIQRILGTKAFAYPKPLSLIRSLIRTATGPNDLILDSFAGTGTTGHAVLDLNSEDDGQRRFILIEMESDICEAITRERLVKVINGYIYQTEKGKSIAVPGLGGGFGYSTLGTQLFDPNGSISGDISFEDLAAHVFFTETGLPLGLNATTYYKSPLLGIHNGVAVYLLFNGILGDKSVNGGNVLTGPLLKNLPEHDGPKVIYGEGNRLGNERLKREGITFKQIPYQIKVS